MTVKVVHFILNIGQVSLYGHVEQRTAPNVFLSYFIELAPCGRACSVLARGWRHILGLHPQHERKAV